MRKLIKSKKAKVIYKIIFAIFICLFAMGGFLASRIYAKECKECSKAKTLQLSSIKPYIPKAIGEKPIKRDISDKAKGRNGIKAYLHTIGTIKKTKDGIELVFNGKKDILKETANGYYLAEAIEGFTKFILVKKDSGEYWIAKDKAGKTYVFGSKAKSTDGSATEWQLDLIIDRSGEYLKFKDTETEGVRTATFGRTTTQPLIKYRLDKYQQPPETESIAASYDYGMGGWDYGPSDGFMDPFMDDGFMDPAMDGGLIDGGLVESGLVDYYAYQDDPKPAPKEKKKKSWWEKIWDAFIELACAGHHGGTCESVHTALRDHLIIKPTEDGVMIGFRSKFIVDGDGVSDLDLFLICL